MQSDDEIIFKELREARKKKKQLEKEQIGEI